MSQLEVSKAEAAEERSEQTRSFVRTMKAAARRKYTPEEKIRIVRCWERIAVIGSSEGEFVHRKLS